MLRQLGLGLLLLVMVALLALNVLAFSGVLGGEETAAPPSTFLAEPPADSGSAGSSDLHDEQVARRRSESRRANRPTFVLTAARGDCWVEVRAGSANGPPLYTGLLEAGGSLSFKRPRLWLRLGAPNVVDITVDGRPSTIPPGTAELTVPRASEL